MTPIFVWHAINKFVKRTQINSFAKLMQLWSITLFLQTVTSVSTLKIKGLKINYSFPLYRTLLYLFLEFINFYMYNSCLVICSALHTIFFQFVCDEGATFKAWCFMADRTYMAHMLWFGGEDKFDGDLLHLFIFEND